MCRVLFCIAFLFCSVFSYALKPSDAFNRLRKGNLRFVRDKSTCSHKNEDVRLSVRNSQSPFAIIVTCSDSRVAPEIVFDEGIGDLFVIRVAGNVIGPYELESILYAAKYLHSSCILVMGHENCGAVDAVVKRQTDDVLFISQLIEPAVKRARKNPGKNLLQTAIELNAENMCDFLKRDPTISKLEASGQLGVRPAFYDFDTGVVTML